MSKITDLSAVIKEADAELLAKKREALRERAKPILRFKERMEESIAECERDLDKAREKLALFASKLAMTEIADDMTAFEELEQEVREATLYVYVPAVRHNWDAVRTGYVSTGLTAMLNAWDASASPVTTTEND